MTESMQESTECRPEIQRIAFEQAHTGGVTGFLPVDPGILSDGPRRPFDLYERVAGEMVLLVSHDVPLTQRTIKNLTNEYSRREGSLYVPSEQGAALTSYTENILNAVLNSRSMGVEARARILHSAALSIMADILASPKVAGSVRRGVALANMTVDFMISEPWALKAMVSLFTKDYYTYTHSVHVCILGVALYRHMVTQDQALLRRMGLGLLLHDTGKSIVRQDVLNKPDRLNEQEFQHMKQHPALGWQVLSEQGIDDDLIRNVVLHHHERPNGTGYPDKLSGPSLTIESRIGAVVDIYDALTTDRPYRKAMPHAKAMEILTSMAPDNLDAELAGEFHKVTQALPTH